MGVIDYENCNFCNQESQTSDHMLFECRNVCIFLEQTRLHFISRFRSSLTAYEAIIGAYDDDYNLRLQKNIVLLHTRMHIYNANNKKAPLDLNQLLEEINEHYGLERLNPKHQNEIDQLFDFFP